MILSSEEAARCPSSRVGLTIVESAIGVALANEMSLKPTTNTSLPGVRPERENSPRAPIPAGVVDDEGAEGCVAFCDHLPSRQDSVLGVDPAVEVEPVDRGPTLFSDRSDESLGPIDQVLGVVHRPVHHEGTIGEFHEMFGGQDSPVEVIAFQ